MKKERMIEMKKRTMAIAMMTAVMLMTGFTALAEETETEAVTESSVDWENGENIQAIMQTAAD